MKPWKLSTWSRTVTVTVTFAVAVAVALMALPVRAANDPLSEDPRVQNALNLVALWLDAQRAYDDIPALSAAVVHDQQLLWADGFGLANREAGVAATSETIYSICSISKLFTSVGVMQLRDEGKLRLDDPVAKHLAWFDIQETFPGSPPVSVEGLLTHSAGLPRESDFPYWTAPFDFPERAAIQSRVSHQSMLYPSQRQFQYSNLGLTLAGEILSELSGRPYEVYVRQRILDPLGMTDTTSEIPTKLHGNRLAVGYSATRREGGRKAVPLFEAQGIAPAAGYASNVLDLAKFASWQFRLLDDEKSGGEDVLAANTLREMQRVHWVDPDWETTWGLGFSVNRASDQKTTFVGHGGSCPGYRTHFRLQTKDRIATVVMANANGVNPGQFTFRAYEVVAPAIRAAQKEPGEGKETPEALKKYVGAYDDFPWGGETQVIPWKGGLALVSFPTGNPLESVRPLKHVEGDRFRRVRDDESLGEEILFETGPDGEVLRFWQHSNPSERIR